MNIPGRSTRAIVDLDAIAGNVRAFRDGISTRTQIMAVVKANGYGHGATMVARTALENGADSLGVATVDEGTRLRVSGITAPILVMGPIHTTEIETALKQDLVLTVADQSFGDALASVAQLGGRSSKVHLKIDTGMHRYGAPVTNSTNLAKVIAATPSLDLVGVFSHFANSDELDEQPTRDQFAAFQTALHDIEARGIVPGCCHIANSAASLRSRDYDLDLIRIGISLYGIAPSLDVPLWPGMRQALTVHSRVHRVIDLKPGDGVSYGSTYRATDRERAALIPVGYADGYHRLLSNRAWMDVSSSRAPVRGRVCMDQTVVGVPVGCHVNLGDDVVVVGNGCDAAPTLAELASLAETIPYEIVTSVAARVPRLYLREGQVVAVEDLLGLRTANPQVSTELD